MGGNQQNMLFSIFNYIWYMPAYCGLRFQRAVVSCPAGGIPLYLVFSILPWFGQWVFSSLFILCCVFLSYVHFWLSDCYLVDWFLGVLYCLCSGVFVFLWSVFLVWLSHSWGCVGFLGLSYKPVCDLCSCLTFTCFGSHQYLFVLMSGTLQSQFAPPHITELWVFLPCLSWPTLMYPSQLLHP